MAAGAGQEVLLLHPESLDELACEVQVTRRGLLIRPRPVRPSRRPPALPPTRIPWWSVQGFSGDETETAPDGSVRQVLEVVTDAGSLYLLAPAPEVGQLVRRVGRHSGRWQRSRSPMVAALSRAWALFVAALVSLFSVVAPAVAAVAATVSAALLRLAAAAGRDVWVAVATLGRALAHLSAPGAGRPAGP